MRGISEGTKLPYLCLVLIPLSLEALFSFLLRSLDSLGFLGERITLTLGYVDCGLFRVDLCRPRLKLFLFDFNLIMESLRFI